MYLIYTIDKDKKQIGSNSELLDDRFIDGAVKGLSGWISCFPKAALAGTVFAGGVDKIGEIKGHKALEKAYRMGRET